MWPPECFAHRESSKGLVRQRSYLDLPGGRPLFFSNPADESPPLRTMRRERTAPRAPRPPAPLLCSYRLSNSQLGSPGRCHRFNFASAYCSPLEGRPRDRQLTGREQRLIRSRIQAQDNGVIHASVNAITASATPGLGPSAEFGRSRWGIPLYYGGMPTDILRGPASHIRRCDPRDSKSRILVRFVISFGPDDHLIGDCKIAGRCSPLKRMKWNRQKIDGGRCASKSDLNFVL